jgi:hypothetical protein
MPIILTHKPPVMSGGHAKGVVSLAAMGCTKPHGNGVMRLVGEWLK